MSKPSFKNLAAKKSHWSRSLSICSGCNWEDPQQAPTMLGLAFFSFSLQNSSFCPNPSTHQREEISSVCAGEGDINKSFTKAKSELQQKLCVFLQPQINFVFSLSELPQIKALPKPSCCYQTKFPSQSGMSLQYSFSTAFHSFSFCPWKTYLAFFLLGLGVYPWGNSARRLSSKRHYHMKQQRWWPEQVGKHKDHIKMVPVESFSHPCALILTSVASRQRVQTQLWGPGVCTHILTPGWHKQQLLEKLRGFSHHSHSCMLRPAEGPSSAALEGPTWARST